MGPLSRVYDRLVNCSGRALVLLRVALLSISLLACGALQRVAFKRIAYPLGPSMSGSYGLLLLTTFRFKAVGDPDVSITSRGAYYWYPVLLLCVISAAFIPLFGVPYLYVKIVAGGTDDTRILPYAVIGALNAVNGILTIFGNAFVPGYLQTILQQTVIPFTMILSVFLCGTRYSAQHVIGVVIIILGVALQLEPLFTDSNSDEVSSSSSTSLSWSLVYLIAPLPVALAAVYQELEFSRRKVNLISLMYWSNLIQALLLFMLVPIQLLASSDSEITRWPAAFRCILKSDETVSPECSDGQAGIYLFSCIFWMLVSQLLQAELVRHAGASLCAVVMTLGLPTTALAFSIPQLMGDHIEPIQGSTILALSVILFGVTMYRTAKDDHSGVSAKGGDSLIVSTESTSDVVDRLPPPPPQRRGSIHPRLYSSGIGIIQSEYTHDEGLECPLLLEHTHSVAMSPRRADCESRRATVY